MISKFPDIWHIKQIIYIYYSMKFLGTIILALQYFSVYNYIDALLLCTFELYLWYKVTIQIAFLH